MMPRVHSLPISADMGKLRLLILVCALCFNVEVAATGSQVTAMALAGHGNPVRRVVKLISEMQAKVSAEGEKQEKMMDKFRCYCSKTQASLEKSIKAAESSIPQLEATIEEGKSAKAQLQSEIKHAKADLAAAGSALSSAAEIRTKEEAAFNAESNSLKTNIASLEKAIPAIEKGSTSFLQSREASVLQRLSVTLDMQSVDRDVLTAFLSGGSSDADGSAQQAPGEILGILKTMKDEMEKDLSSLVANEDAAKADFANLESAKKKEVAALTKQVESQTRRLGNLAVELVDAEDSLEDTSEAFAEDQKFLANLKNDCKTKEVEYEKYKKTQAAELLALSETIEILNSGDALELFQKTMPSGASSFMQIQVSAKDVKRRAVNLLAAQLQARRGGVVDPRIDLLELALRGGKVGFEQIIEQIEKLMTVLREEQNSDEARKAHCTKEMDKAEGEVKALNVASGSLTKAIAEGKESMSSLASEVAALSAGIEELDKAVAEATTQRKEENEYFKEALAQQGGAKDLLLLAKNRMSKFYKPEQAASAMQLNAEFNDAEEVHHGKQDASGVLAMFDTLIADVESKILELKLEEKDAQASYEKLLKDAQVKRALDAKAVMDKESAKATVEAEVMTNKKALKTSKVELAETQKYLMSLHSECDFHLKYFDARKAAREDELDGLSKAKDVLSGSDYSFLQLRAATRHRGF